MVTIAFKRLKQDQLTSYIPIAIVKKHFFFKKKKKDKPD